MFVVFDRNQAAYLCIAEDNTKYYAMRKDKATQFSTITEAATKADEQGITDINILPA